MPIVINSSSENLCERLNEMILDGKSPQVYIVGCKNFNKNWENMVKIAGSKLSGAIINSTIFDFCGIKNYNNYVSKIHLETFTLERMAEQKCPVIIVNQGGEIYNKIADYIYSVSQCREMSIFSTSSFKHSGRINGVLRIFDKTQYLKSHPWYYDMIFNKFPIEKRAVRGFLTISNGRHYTTKEYVYENSQLPKIFFFSNSKMMGHYIPDEETVPCLLQKYLLNEDIEYVVENHSVNANQLLNPLLQLQAMNINSGDVVIVAHNLNYLAMISKDIEVDFVMRGEVLIELYHHCDNRGAHFLFVNLGYLFNVVAPTEIEQFLANALGKKFINDIKGRKMNKFATINRIPYLDLTFMLNNPNRVAYFLDDSHYTPEGTHAVADEIAEYIKLLLKPVSQELDKQVAKELEKMKFDFINLIIQKFETPELLSHLASLKEISTGKPENSGVIVMNCNPFTLGHRYLIETAKSQVDHLYILVVEEDRSTFKFNDRFEMIKLGVADIAGVDVLPSGQFVISTITFPEYFDKDAKQSETIDPTMDVEVFCSKIAPALRVKKRFVGEEPLDRITDQYNQKMLEILPKHGIEFIVIPRKETGGAPISASRVRKLLEEGNSTELLSLVPQTTYDYLTQMKLIETQV